MSTLFGYARVSGRDQAESGLGIAAQNASLLPYGRLLINSPYHGGDLFWDEGRFPADMPEGIYADLAVSAFKVPLLSRPAFVKIVARARRGDHVIFTRLDRAFRNLQDFANSTAFLVERGISLHFSDQQIDFSSANGRLMCQVLAAFAEWESAIKSERMREAHALRRQTAPPVPKKRRGHRAPLRAPALVLPRPREKVQELPPGLAYGYVRCSHLDSTESGLGIAAQKKGVWNYFDFLRQRPEFASVAQGELVEDLTVSAFRVPLLKREGGRRLDHLLKPGDHVIVARMDRAFRSLKDFATVHEAWKERGVTLHLADQNLNLGSANGRVMAGLIALVAAWESEVKSERNLSVTAQLKLHGLRYNKTDPRFTTHVNNGQGRAKLLPDFDERIVGRYILLRHRRDGLSFERIADRIEACLANREGRPPLPECGRYDRGQRKWITRQWTRQIVGNCYRLMQKNIARCGDPFSPASVPQFGTPSFRRRRHA